MEFSKEFLSNKVYSEQALMFDAMPAETIRQNGEKVSLETGALTQPNGDILFRVYAPGARDVVAVVTGAHGDHTDCPLARNENGFFEGIYPYNETYSGPHTLNLMVNGTPLLYPYLPVSWAGNRPVNCIEVPDPETGYISINHVPHGAVSREIYWSEEFAWQRCNVYTPPGYRKTSEAYPVLYLLHGGSQNETTWEYNGRVAHIMDNLIAKGKCVPFIIVMPDGMRVKPGDVTESSRNYAGFEKSLLNACIPFIEENYRVKNDKWNRAIGGFSRGSAQSYVFGLQNPGVFGSIAVMSGQYSREGMAKELYDRGFDPDFIGKNYKVFLRTMGDCEPRYKRWVEESALCEERGISALPCYHQRRYSYQRHEWGSCRRAIHDYAQLLFRS